MKNIENISNIENVINIENISNIDNINKIKIFDGGMGSTLEELGLITECVEDLNITHSDAIKSIHKSYSVADYITTNTFGLNKFKYTGKYSIKEVALKAIENAKVVNKKTFFDIGPTGLLMKPLGSLSFEDAYECFKELVLITKDYVDGYIVETFSDLLEIKACILAIKENSNKQVFATMTFQANGRTLTGTSPEIMVNTLEGLNVDVLGVNCSLGPKDLIPIVEKIMTYTHTPVLVQANRGIPKYNNGKATYELTADEFKEYNKKFIDLGVSIIGGCCGTNAEFINKIACFKKLDIKKVDNPYYTFVNSKEKIVNVNDIVICGERLNPTGKKRLKEAIVNEDYDYLINEAIIQKENGASILDVNVGLPLIDEVKVLKIVTQKVSEYVDLPLQIDSSNVDAIEEAVRVYPGIPIINSVNGNIDVMNKVFRIAKKYGAVVIGLTLDEKGVPNSVEDRYEIALRIINKALEFKVMKHKLIIDTLVLTVSSNQELVNVTLETLSKINDLGVNTTLGVSNVSFGLPNRELLNKTFLVMALNKGLKMPIINPLDSEMVNALSAYKVLNNKDIGSVNYINKFANQNITNTNINNNIINNKTVSEMIIKGIKSNIKEVTLKEISNYNNPLDFIESVLINSLNEVGNLYEKGIIFLPQLIASSEASKLAFEAVLERIPSSLVEKGTIIIGTVKGDVHDIGKNIIKVVLQSYGYSVIDLGKDVDKSIFLDAYNKHKPIAIAMSALMTTTINSMKEAIELLRESDVKAKIFVGGAVLNNEIAKKINADYYCKNALEMINILNNK